jgi:hypothetical protein
MLSGLLAPCMRHVRHWYAAGFLQRSRLRFDMAVHWAALCFVTLGSGMLNSAEFVDWGGRRERAMYFARIPHENKGFRLLPPLPLVFRNFSISFFLIIFKEIVAVVAIT